MMEAIEVIDYKGYKIEIYPDEMAESPRGEGYDNLSTMVCFHGRYELGDKTDLNSDMFNGWAELEAYLIKEKKAEIILPLYMYDHSGITISTTPFSCPWDSGQIGFVYVSKKAIQKEYGRCTKLARKKAEKVLLSEVETYDQYIRGEVYGYKIMKDEKEIDSCWSWFGDYKEMIKECKIIIENKLESKKELALK